MSIDLLHSRFEKATARRDKRFFSSFGIDLYNMASDGKKSKPKQKSNEEIFAGFQSLRNEQRNIASKLSELELEVHEHKVVIDTLKDVDPARKCFRMIGGILVERTVKDVLPTLQTNSEQLSSLIDSMTEALTKKGQEVNDYKQLHNIVIRSQDQSAPSEIEEIKERMGTNVLV